MFLFQFSFHYWNFQRPPSVLIFGHFYLLFNRFATETVAWFIALEFVLFLYYVYSYFRIIGILQFSRKTSPTITQNPIITINRVDPREKINETT